MRVARLLWRHLPAGAEPLHLGWIQRARGRWNTQRPRLSCLYTAYTQEGALAEFAKLAAQRPAFARTPRDLVSIHVTVSPVLDLLDAEIQRRYGVTLADMTGDGTRHLAACRRVARHVVADGYRAIRAPSAASEGEVNLMIYPESQHGSLLLSDGPIRLPINYGPHPLRP